MTGNPNERFILAHKRNLYFSGLSLNPAKGWKAEEGDGVSAALGVIICNIGNHLPNLCQFIKNGNLKGGTRKLIEIFEGGDVATNHPIV